jgi:UDP-3-O-acyl N-acetylglucosamine deacetylase
LKFQKTIKKNVSLSGQGLHTGRKTTVIFKPAPVDTGVWIVRKDFSPPLRLKVSIENVVDDRLAITLGNERFKVTTIEHILAALAGLEIDNLMIELDGEEPPIMDGSARPFVEAFLETGIEKQNGVVPYWRLDQPIWEMREDKHLIVLPSDNLKIAYTIEFDHHLLESQSAFFLINENTFIEQISPARTFCFLNEVSLIRGENLGRGGSVENTVILGEERYLTELRFKNECVRHKILDLLAALYLLGRPIKAYFIARKSGHYLDISLIKRLFTHFRHQNRRKK